MGKYIADGRKLIHSSSVRKVFSPTALSNRVSFSRGSRELAGGGSLISQLKDVGKDISYADNTDEFSV